MNKQIITIVGLGMMGGSLALALKKQKSKVHVIGVGRNPERLKKARKLKICNEVTDHYNQAIPRSDLVVICTTVNEIVPTFKKILPLLKPGAVATDIGSVKTPVLKDVSEIFNSRLTTHDSRLHFIGSHPMTGSEKTGFENAQADLYHNAMVVLCPLGSSSFLKTLQKFWHSVGAKTLVMPAEVHDLLVAETSHLPHVMAGAYVQMLSTLQKHDANTAKLLAGSFRDITRIADADSNQWAEIAHANQRFLLAALKSYRDILNRVIQKTERSDDSFAEWKNFFQAARSQRQKLLKISNLIS